MAIVALNPAPGFGMWGNRENMHAPHRGNYLVHTFSQLLHVCVEIELYILTRMLFSTKRI